MNTTKKAFNKGNKTTTHKTDHRRHNMKATTLDVYSHDTDNAEKQEVDNMDNYTFRSDMESLLKEHRAKRSDMQKIALSLRIIEDQAAKLSSLIKDLSAINTDDITDPFDIIVSLQAAADMSVNLHSDICETNTNYLDMSEGIAL